MTLRFCLGPQSLELKLLEYWKSTLAAKMLQKSNRQHGSASSKMMMDYSQKIGFLESLWPLCRVEAHVGAEAEADLNWSKLVFKFSTLEQLHIESVNTFFAHKRKFDWNKLVEFREAKTSSSIKDVQWNCCCADCLDLYSSMSPYYAYPSLTVSQMNAAI